MESIEIEGLQLARRDLDDQSDVLLKALLASPLTLADDPRERTRVELGQFERAAANARSLILLLSASGLRDGTPLAVLTARRIVRPRHKALTVAESNAGGN